MFTKASSPGTDPGDPGPRCVLFLHHGQAGRTPHPAR